MSNPLKGKGGIPLLRQETAEDRFIGRVTVELIESPEIESDAHGLAMSVSPSLSKELSQQDVLKNISTALSVHTGKGKLLSPELHITSDPLTKYGGTPLIAGIGPNQRYQGRVTVEVFESPGKGSSEVKLAVSTAPANGSSISPQDLFKRVAAALPIRTELEAKWSENSTPPDSGNANSC